MMLLKKNRPNNRAVTMLGQVVMPSIILGLCLVLLSGCSQASRRWFGVERTPPDESVIGTNPPLTMPPDYRLRPPASKDSNTTNTTEGTGKTATDTRNILLKNTKEGEGAAPSDKGENATKPKN